MFFFKLDFLSSPQQFYFLNKRTNKTIFGGILFIIYILIIMNIFISYILDFYLNDKYDIRYSLYNNFTNFAEENNKIEEFNPILNFSINMKRITKDLEELDLNDQFYLIDANGNFIERNSIISRAPSDMDITIVYFCSYNCSLDEDNNDDLVYILNISYSGYKIDHQNDKIPLEKNSDKYPFYKEIYFSLSKSRIYNINWGIITYKEERGLLGLFDNYFNIKNRYTSIDINNIEEISIERTIDVVDIMQMDIIDFNYKILSIITMNKGYNQYIEYTRTKKSILDVFANIGALFSTLFTLFNFIFSFYSRNFNNYEIVKAILSVPKLEAIKTGVHRSKTIKFDNINRKNKYNIKDDNHSFNTSKSVPFKSKGININNKIKIPKSENYNKCDFNLSNINFIHFLGNNIYYKRKNKRKEQKIIELCNNIVSKYSSIDVILSYQIIFENLMKDYKWNENYLKNISNNNLIKKLELIS